MCPKAFVTHVATMFACCLYAQQPLTTPDFSPKSPEAGEFLKYGDYPVNLSTGVPSIQIPLYTLETGGYSLPIALQYHSSGIKVSQEATWVGLGWNIDVGAKIVLEARDGPDEYNLSFNSMPSGPDVLQHMQDFPYDFDLDASKNSWVKDVYHFSSPTASGKFYINDNSSGGIVVFPADAFKVTTSGSLTNRTFTVRDKNGNTYFFGNTREKSQTIAQYDESWHTSAWLVDRIETPFNRNIYFSYASNGGFNQQNYADKVTYTKTYDPLSACNGNEAQEETISSIQNGTSIYNTQTKKLEQIIFDGGKISFGLSRDRLDMPTTTGSIAPAYLSTLQVYSKVNGTFLLEKQFDFDYSYFESSSSVESPKKYRLKLNGITDVLGGDKTTSFSYSNITMPNKDSKAQDYWGYYNGAANSDLIPPQYITYTPTTYSTPVQTTIGSANRSVNTAYNQAGILKEIKHPTGGVTKFEYEPNEYYGIDEFQQFQRFYDFIKLSGAGNGSSVPSSEPECEFSTTSSCPQSRSFSFDVSSAGAELTYNIRNVNSPIVLENKYSYAEVTVYSNGSNIFYKKSRYSTGEIIVPLSISGYTNVEIKVYGNDMVVEAGLEFYENGSSTMKNNIAGGLRIKNIENFDSDISLLKKVYTYKVPGQTNVSSGILRKNNKLNYSDRLPVSYNPVYCNGVLGGDWKEIRTTIFSSSSISGIESASVDYQYVKEESISPTGENNGYAAYEFMITPDYLYDTKGVIKVKTDWKRGLLVEKRDFKKAGSQYLEIKRTSNSYTEDPNITAVFRGFKLFPLNVISSGSYSDAPFTLEMAYEVADYSIAVPWFYKDKTSIKEYFYNPSNVLLNSLTSEEDYYYGNPEHLQLTKKELVTSDGNTIRSEFYYPDDVDVDNDLGYNSILSIAEYAAIDQLKAVKDNGASGLHRIAQPVQQVTEVFSGSQKLSSLVERNLFKDYNGLVLPQRLQTAKLGENLEDRLAYFDYDQYGNLLEASRENGPPVSYIWGYDEQYPIAKVENANYSELSPYVANLQLLSQQDKDHGTGSTDSEQKLRVALNNLRINLPSNAMVSTYTYDPLIGITSTTDASGRAMFYENDSADRLRFIKDGTKNILEEYSYNYASGQSPALVVSDIAVSPSSISVGQNVTFSVSASGGSGNYSYQWSMAVGSQPSTNYAGTTSNSKSIIIRSVYCPGFTVTCKVTDLTTGESITKSVYKYISSGCGGPGIE